uniref:Uncharacterized protein n=1 Tax=Anguilla anguilla TaxID=7936 RepID=A0A0E9Y0J2_ANGAN
MKVISTTVLRGACVCVSEVCVYAHYKLNTNRNFGEGASKVCPFHSVPLRVWSDPIKFIPADSPAGTAHCHSSSTL